MQALINKLQAGIHICDDHTLCDLLLSVRRGMENKQLELQADRRKLLKTLKTITDNRVPDWVRKKLETMIKELEKQS